MVEHSLYHLKVEGLSLAGANGIRFGDKISSRIFTDLAIQLHLEMRQWLERTNLLLHPPLSHSDHLVIKGSDGLGSHTFWYFRTDYNKKYIDVFIKALFGANLYLYVLQISIV